MKISEMTNDQAAAALLRLSGPFSEICDDEEAVAIVEEYKARNSKPYFYAVGKMIPAIVQHLLVKHKKALYEIISVLAGVPVSKVGAMKLPETVKVVQDSWDEVAETFFPSSAKSRRKGAGG